jgi:hypothetical protein
MYERAATHGPQMFAPTLTHGTGCDLGGATEIGRHLVEKRFGLHA